MVLHANGVKRETRECAVPATVANVLFYNEDQVFQLTTGPEGLGR